MIPRALLPLALLVALALAAPAASAQETLTIVAHDDGGADAWFTVEGLDGRNPEVTLVPGETYEIAFRNEGTIGHNLHFGEPMDAATEAIPPGETATLSFTVPDDASGSTTYWCDPHVSMMMEGPVAFAASASEGSTPTGATPGGTGDADGAGEGGAQESGEGNDAPAPGLLATLAVAGVAVAVWGRRPA